MAKDGDGSTRRKFAASVRANLPLALLAITVITVFIIIIALILTMARGIFRPLPLPEADRIECPGFTEENCTNFHCIYEEVSVGPSCYMGRNNFSFKVQSVNDEESGIEIQMTNLVSSTPYGPSLKKVNFKLTYLTGNILRFQFKDAEKERYEVPVQEHFPLLQNLTNVTKSNLVYEIIHTNVSDVFNFAVKRKNGKNVWDSRVGALLLSDQYLQIASYLPTGNVYGLGEHVHDSLQHSMEFKSWPMFARDYAAKPDGSRKNLYGVHPFYTCLEEGGKSHGVLFLNSNAMEATFMPAPAVSFRTIGGILDFFIFVGDNPEHVVQLYTSLIGRPMMPPYWSLGFQLSRYGYNQITVLKEVHERNHKAKIPIAVQYLDIDHMEENRDFTYDAIRFPGLPEYIEEQRKEHGMKWVIILDPAISSRKDYHPYSAGVNQSVFIRRSSQWKDSMFPEDLDKNFVYGKVWPPEYVVFPDFFQDSTKEWWKELIVEHKKQINFDALWIDMNEPSSFGTNEVNPDYCAEDVYDEKECWSLKCPKSRYEYPPYNPLLSTGDKRISKKTICMESVQGNQSFPLLHYNVHSLYGWSQTEPTLRATQAATNSRSFVISRSTYPSSGRHGGHWLGDNCSSFDDLKKSIIGILEFNLFGIPYVGADVCGFFGDTSAILCKRWMQLGAFYPYYRNHNVEGRWDQDPAGLGHDVAEASRKAIERRISFNPYLYTLFYKAHTLGSTVVRPVFHEFPLDPLTWNLDIQFMWGSALLISPILDEIPNSLSVYLPKAEWWRFAWEKSWKEPFTERYVIATDADEYTPIHIRGGSIIPYETFVPYDPKTNSTSRNMTLYVFTSGGKASGDMFADDGVSQDTIENDAYATYDFAVNNCTLKITSNKKSKFTGPANILEKVVVFGETKVKTVSNKYAFTADDQYNCTTITVGSKFSDVQQIQWETTDGKCPKIS